MKPILTQDEIDQMSDALKKSTLRDHLRHIETPPAVAYFSNMSHGVEFRRADGYKPDGHWEPLYLTPAIEGQEAVAWSAEGLITQDRSLYDRRLKWAPLFTARPSR